MSTKSGNRARARASLELLYSISRELAAHLDLNALLGRILELTLESVAAFSGSILVIDERGRVAEGSIAYGGRVHNGTAAQLADTLENGLAGWVVEHRKAVLIPSTRDDPRWMRRVREEAKGVTRSAISVPLIARTRVVGVLTLVHPDEGHFQPEDLELLQAIAEQAGIAVENARLFAAEQQRRRFASTLQEIARSLNSSLDPSTVFPMILDQLQRVVKFDSAAIFVLEDQTLRLAAAKGFADAEALVGTSLPADKDTLMGRVIHSRHPVVVDDVQGAEGWLPEPQYQGAEKIRGWIGAPLLVRDRAVGVLTVDSHTRGAYGEEQVEVVTAFAHQAATAVANARLYEQSRRQMEAMVALAETARVVTASLDLDEVLQRILSQTIRTLNVEAASLALLDADGMLEFKAASGSGAQSMMGIRLERGKGIAGWVAEHDEPIFVADVRRDPRFYGAVDEKIGFQTQSLACVPIRVQDQIIGVLEAINPARGKMDQQEIEILMGIAGLAGTAISHARLFSETQAARRRYASLFEDSIDPILITDLRGIVADANQRAQSFLGLSRRELIGQSILQWVAPGVKGEQPNLADMQAGDSASYEVRRQGPQGQELCFEVYLKRIDVGDEPFMQWILHDVAERVALDKLRADLTSMIFHDLRSPLGNVISSLEVMDASLEQDDPLGLRPVLSVAQRSSRRLSRLIDSLLDLDRLEAGKAHLYRVQVKLPELLQEALEEVRPIAEAKGHTLAFENQAGELEPLEVDESMIRRVVINLLENAVKYTPPGGSIALSLARQDGQVRVGVSDTGPGIALEARERIFEKFARLEGGKAKGLGLGLAFCRLAVEAHGGRIWVESDPPHGATFYFTLPL